MDEYLIERFTEQCVIEWNNKVGESSPYSRYVNEWMNEWMFNDTPARKTDRLLGVRKR